MSKKLSEVSKRVPNCSRVECSAKNIFSEVFKISFSPSNKKYFLVLSH